MIISLHSVNGPNVPALNTIHKGEAPGKPIIIKVRVIYLQLLYIVLYPKSEEQSVFVTFCACFRTETRLSSLQPMGFEELRNLSHTHYLQPKYERVATKR